MSWILSFFKKFLVRHFVRSFENEIIIIIMLFLLTPSKTQFDCLDLHLAASFM